MDRRTFLAGTAAVLLAAPLAAEAQPAGKVFRVGLLSYSGCDRPTTMVPFREGLRASGYVEGRNIVIECRGGPRLVDRLSDLAAELVRLNVDVLVAESTPAGLAAKQATQTIPIVLVIVADPVGSGLATSLARPGGNVTGLSVLSEGIVQKALEILKEVAPRVSRVAVMMDVTNQGQRRLDAPLDTAAKILGVRLQRMDVRSAATLDDAIATALKQRVEALFVYPLPIPPSDRQKIVEFGIKNRLPMTTILRPYAEDGMLMSYGVNFPDQFRRAAGYVDKILKGAKPADLPIEQPTKFELVINLKTAKALGLTIPPSLLQRADEVIQ
jgi:putative ABC transport system substrate-binding protein